MAQKTASNAPSEGEQTDLEELPVSLERDPFLRELLGTLSGTLEEVIGLHEASGFISIVGQRMGERIDGQYRHALSVERLPPDRIADVLVDLKRRIRGDFYVIEADEDKIVLGNRRCPFGDSVHGRSSLCMMTSNVFGTITAENLGFAKVALHETIARGHDGCRIVIYLSETEEAAADEGNEYYGS